MHYAEVIEQVAIRGARPPVPEGTPQELQALMQSCWQADPTKRPGFNALCTCLDLLLRPWLARLPCGQPAAGLPPIESTSTAPALSSGATGPGSSPVGRPPVAPPPQATSRGSGLIPGDESRPAPGAPGSAAAAAMAPPPADEGRDMAAQAGGPQRQGQQGIHSATVGRGRGPLPPHSRFIGSWE
jgi:hypothetical protein